jgi:hypothetical protein
MLVSGEIENVPLLDVLQVVSYSKQTGVLSVAGDDIRGALVFDRGAVVCGESTSTRQLLERASKEEEPRRRLALRRVGTLAVLTELLCLRSGAFRFQGKKEPLVELAGVGLAPFYEEGALDTGELLLVLANAIDKPAGAPSKKSSEPPSERERAHPRYSPTLVPASLALGDSLVEGHLTNLSEGGAHFDGEALPPAEGLVTVRFTLPGDLGQVVCRARVAWARADGKSGSRGAGLAFVEMSHEGRGRLAAYLARFQRLADEYLEPDPISPRTN